MLEVLERLETGKKSKGSSDDDGAEGGLGFAGVGKAGKAVLGGQKLRSRARKHPLQVARSYRSEIKRALGVRRGMAWTYFDYRKRRIPWGKLYDLKKPTRC